MKKFTTFFLLTFLPLSAYAISEQEQQDASSNQNRLIQRENQLNEGKIKEKDLQQVEKDQKEAAEMEENDDDFDDQDGKVVQDLSPIQCFRVNKIIFSPNKIIGKSYEKKFTNTYIGKCITLRQIAKFSKKLSDHLTDEGYITSRVEIPAQNLASGVLTINVIESYLENLTFNNENFFDKTQKFTAFGYIKKNKVLNLRKIEHGLEQVNRLSSNSATMKVLPGKGERSSVVAIENIPNRRLRLNASYDNGGNRVTGEKRDTVGLSQDNLFWLNDNLNISRTSNDFDKNRKTSGGTHSVSSSFSVPLKWYTLTLSYSKSSYFFWGGDTQRFKSHGITDTRIASLDRTLIKNKKIKLASNLTLTSRYSRNFQADEKVLATSRKASIGYASLPITFFLDNSTLFLKPGYSKALNILDAQKNNPNIPSNVAHAEFDIFKFYGNYTKKTQIFATPISYNGSFDSQISKQTLYGSDGFSIGGLYSIRGFKEGSISEDSGYTFRNELAVNLGQAIVPYLSPEKGQYFTSLYRFSVTPFYDYGYVRSKGGNRSGRLSGGGFKIGFDYWKLNTSLTFSRALSKSQFLGKNKSDDNAVFFNVSSEFGFF